jgi:aryl-alcohol dehydrogenase-like predicted oxidoreductase
MKLARSCAPLGSVSLFGARLPAVSSAANTRAKISAKATIVLSGFDFFPFDKELGFQVVEKIRAIANECNASVAQIALAWLLSKAVVASIILGASKLSQLEGNLGAIDVKLSDSQIAALAQITAPPSLYPNWFNTNMVDDKHKEIFGTNRAEPF